MYMYYVYNIIYNIYNICIKYVEPALNNEMVRAVLTKRQTSDCDV